MFGKSPASVEKPLHTANIATCLTTLAMAADLTLLGGASLLIGAALSGTSLWPKLSSDDRSVAQAMAATLDSANHLTPDRHKILLGNLARLTPNDEDIVAASRKPAVVAKAMRDKLEATPHDDPSYNTAQALSDYETMLIELLTPYLRPKTLDDATSAKVLENTQLIIEKLELSGQATRLRDAGINEPAILKLAH